MKSSLDVRLPANAVPVLIIIVIVIGVPHTLCAVMCNLIDTHICTQTHKYTHESSSGDGRGRDGDGTGTRTEQERVEERRRSARNRTRVVDAMWETGRLGWKEKKRR